MRAVTLWNEVIEDSNYSSIKDNEDFVASEVHSRPAGSNGAEYFRAAVQHTIGESNGPMETAEKAEQESWSGQEMADIKQEEVPETETSSRAWTANEDKSSSAPGQLQGPKLLFSIKKNKDFDNLAQFIRNKGHLGDHEFLYELAKLFGFKGDNLNHSFYANLDNGNDLRIADHSGNAQNYRNIGNAAGVHHGVVIKLSPARFKSIKGIRYKEYVYYPDKMDSARQIAIVEGLKHYASNGDFSKMPLPDVINPRKKFSLSPKDVAVRDAIVDKINAGGIYTSLSDKEGQRVLRLARRNVLANKKTVPDTGQTSADIGQASAEDSFISETDIAKVCNNLDITKEKIEKPNLNTFISDIAKAIGAKRGNSLSQYVTIRAKNEDVVTLRLSNHNATVSNFDSHNITINSITHALKNHGENGLENSENSIPLREKDMELAPYIMTSPDYVRKGNPDALGRESIRFYKTLGNGYVVVVEKEQKNSPDDMDTITMWAERSTNVTDARSKRTSPMYHAQSVIISDGDTAKIRKDAKKTIKESIEAEEHPDYKKNEDGIRRIGNGVNPNVLIHRLYGAVSIDGEVYRAKITMDEYLDANKQNRPHSYEATKIELLSGTLVDGSSRSIDPRPNNSISAAKLLKGVEKSYDKGKKLLDESENLREQRVYHGSAADFDKFDSSHMGEGEGEQAHGWGHYVALDRNTGMMYANSNLYSVDIPDDNGRNYLEEAKPLTDEQKQMILSTIPPNDLGERIKARGGLNDEHSTGRNLYEALSMELGGAKQASMFLNRAGFVGIHYNGRVDGECYVIFKGSDMKLADKVKLFQGQNGKILGFTVGGRIYLDPKYATAETPIHEYTHLWAQAIRNVNSGAWSDIVSLMKDEPELWKKVSLMYPELSGDDLVEEVLAHYSGKQGAERLDKEIREAAYGEGDIFSKADAVSALDRIRQAVRAFWKRVADLLHIRFTTAEEVADRVLADLVNGVNPVEAARSFGEDITEDGVVRESRITDKALIDKLEGEKKIKLYRAMQFIDGKLYSPMAARFIDEKTGRKEYGSPIELGTWEKSDERPEAVKDGKIELDKGLDENGKPLGTVKVAYNPYIHSSRSPLNDQFSSAYKRPNLVVVETDVPESELTSKYHAKYAKNSTGEIDWHSGPVSSKLPKSKARKVVLSRYDKPIRIVPDSEVADKIAGILEGENIRIPSNVVTPSLRSELDKRGVEITDEKKNNSTAGSVRLSNSDEMKGHDSNSLLNRLQNEAETINPMQLTDEIWSREIKDKVFKTPIGDVRFGKNQYKKNIKKGREKEFGMMIPTIERPDLIFEETVPEEGAERQTKYVFVKCFTENKAKSINYASVTVKKDGIEVVNSSHYLMEKQLLNKIEKEQMLWNRLEVDSTSSAQGSSNDQNNALSASKDNKNSEKKNSDNNIEYSDSNVDTRFKENDNSTNSAKFEHEKETTQNDTDSRSIGRKLSDAINIFEIPSVADGDIRPSAGTSLLEAQQFLIDRGIEMDKEVSYAAIEKLFNESNKWPRIKSLFDKVSEKAKSLGVGMRFVEPEMLASKEGNQHLAGRYYSGKNINRNDGTVADSRKDIETSASELGKRLGVKVRFVRKVNEITDKNENRQRRMRKAKAWERRRCSYLRCYSKW